MVSSSSKHVKKRNRFEHCQLDVNVNVLLAKQKLHIEVPTEVKEKLVDLGYDPAMGARPLRRGRFKISRTESLNSV